MNTRSPAIPIPIGTKFYQTTLSDNRSSALKHRTIPASSTLGMSGFSTPPVILAETQPHNSHRFSWHLRFSIIWCSALGFFVLLSVPRIIRAVRAGRGLYDFRNWIGVKERHEPEQDYDSIADTSESVKAENSGARWTVSQYLDNVAGILNAFFCFTIPKVGLNVGQVILLVSYTATVLICMVKDTRLLRSPNRPGFLSVAQLPIVFLFATKNSIIYVLLGPGVGYEKLNFLHRWSGRVTFFAALLHGALWIKVLLKRGKPILGQEKETTGIVAFSFLALTVLVSLRPARIFVYQAFFSLHLVFSATFYVALLYHTSSAAPWIYTPLAIYGLDILLRMLRYRFNDGVLVPIGDEMTLVHIPHATSGWVAGQHIRLRIFFSGRVFESHPFTIFSATPDLSCITSMPTGLSLGIKVAGDWTRALNKYANDMVKTKTKESHIQDDGAAIEFVEKLEGNREILNVPVQVLIDGPYGGSTVDLGDYETVLLVTGGSGITFTLGLLDDIVGRCVRKGRKNGEKTKRIEFSWCIRSLGQLEWFSSALADIATIVASSAASPSALYLHISIYVTGPGNPDVTPPIPNCDVITQRPSVDQILRDLINGPKDEAMGAGGAKLVSDSPHSKDPETAVTGVIDDDEESVSPELPVMKPGEHLAVCASGPARLTTEIANAVARVQLSKKGRGLGMIGLHTEVFAL